MPCFRKGAMELFKRIYNDYRELQLIVEVKVEIIDRIASIWSIFTEGFHSKCDITHKKAQKHYLLIPCVSGTVPSSGLYCHCEGRIPEAISRQDSSLRCRMTDLFHAFMKHYTSSGLDLPSLWTAVPISCLSAPRLSLQTLSTADTGGAQISYRR